MGNGPGTAVVWLLLTACAPVGADSAPTTEGPEDRDGDGWETPDDCDDLDPTVSPGAAEACNGVDDDCSGEVDEGLTLAVWPDTDGDGWGRTGPPQIVCEPNGFVTESGDCDDDDPTVHPGAVEHCGDDIDDDCDGAIDAQDDDAVGRVVNYTDGDDDGYGTGDGAPTCDDSLVKGAARAPGDCDDTDPAVNPGAVEVCTEGAGYALDDDCDGLTDTDDPSVVDAVETWPDRDGDGFGDPAGTSVLACHPSADRTANDFDCDDTDELANPAADEICTDGSDNDCDGDVDVCGAIGDVPASGAAGRIVGVDSSGLTGIAVADAGDIDGDGAHDMVVGSWLGGSSTSGTASLFLGAVTGDITTKSADLTIDSPSTGDSLGWAVAGAGDYDDDRFGDLLIGAYGLGRAFLFCGPVSGSYAAADADVVLRSDGSGRAGYSLAGIDDLDGDGHDDVLVGAPLTADAGRVYVVFGSTEEDVRLEDAAVRITGPSGSALGSSLDASTDFDGDGLRDALVGAPHEDTTHVGAGTVYLFAGSDLDAELYAIDATGALVGGTEDAALGTSMGAGDLDGDGYPDLVAGAPTLRSDAVAGGDTVGAALVVRGPISGSVDEADADAVLWGEEDAAEAGSSIAAGGDADRDGNEDLAVGAPGAASAPGAVYLVLGPIADGTQELAGIAHARVVGEAPGSATGRASAWLEDPEGDGMDDLLVGAPFHSEEKAPYVGAAYRFDGWEW
jgi:hypothetical protein